MTSFARTILVVACCSFALLSCSEDEPSGVLVQPTITGEIHFTSEPISFGLKAVPTRGGEIEIEVLDTGTFSAQMPPGEYVLELNYRDEDGSHRVYVGARKIPTEGSEVIPILVQPRAEPIHIPIVFSSVAIEIQRSEFWMDDELRASLTNAESSSRRQLTLAPGSETAVLRFENVTSSTKTFWVLNRSAGVMVHYPGTSAYRQSERFWVDPGEEWEGTVDLRNPTLVSGSIPPPGVPAVVTLRSSDGELANMEVDEAGAFSAGVFYEGACTAVIRMGSQSLLIENAAGEDREFLIRAGVPNDIRIEDPSLTVIMELPSWIDQPRLRLELHSTQGGRISRANLNDSSPFLFPLVPPGEYTLQLRAISPRCGSPLTEMWYPGVADEEMAETWTVGTDKQTLVVPFPSTVGAVVEGFVADQNRGWGLSGDILLFQEDAHDPYCSVSSVSDGRFVIQGVPAGTFELRFDGDDGRSVWYGGTEERAEGRRITLAHGSRLSGVRFEL